MQMQNNHCDRTSEHMAVGVFLRKTEWMRRAIAQGIELQWWRKVSYQHHHHCKLLVHNGPQLIDKMKALDLAPIDGY